MTEILEKMKNLLISLSVEHDIQNVGGDTFEKGIEQHEYENWREELKEMSWQDVRDAILELF